MVDGGSRGPGPGGRATRSAVLGLRAQLLLRGCLLPLSAPCHGPSSRVFVHLLSKGSSACLTSWPLAHVPLIACPDCHASGPSPFQWVHNTSSYQRVSVFPSYAQGLNICNQPRLSSSKHLGYGPGLKQIFEGKVPPCFKVLMS